MPTYGQYALQAFEQAAIDYLLKPVRDEAGKVSLTLRGHTDRLQVSRLYAHLFKPM